MASTSKPLQNKRFRALRLLNSAEDLFMFWKPPGLLLGEDLLTINDDFEDSPVRSYQFRFDAEFIFNCIRQTDGFGIVISYDAVFDRYIQFIIPPCCHLLQHIQKNRTQDGRVSPPSVRIGVIIESATTLLPGSLSHQIQYSFMTFIHFPKMPLRLLHGV